MKKFMLKISKKNVRKKNLKTKKTKIHVGKFRALLSRFTSMSDSANITTISIDVSSVPITTIIICPKRTVLKL